MDSRLSANVFLPFLNLCFKLMTYKLFLGGKCDCGTGKVILWLLKVCLPK